MSFLGFEIAKRAMIAHRQAMDVSGHNIANAKTPGFSRQRVNLRTTTPIPDGTGRDSAGLGQFGTGMEIAGITRLRDLFLDKQYRDQASGLGNWSTRDQVFGEVQQIFAEPSDTSLRTVLDQFWQSWQSLANNPENLAARETVKQRALAWINALQAADRQLGDMRANLDASVAAKVNEVNTLATQIASANERIAYALGAGQQPNDLMDQRDLLIDRLSRITDVTVLDGMSGTVRVLVGGMALVDGVKSYALATEPDPANGNLLRVRWEGAGAPLEIGGGELRAYLDLRDVTLPGYRAQVKDLAWAVAAEINAVHATGYDLNGNPAGPFFTLPASKADFQVSNLAVDANVLADSRRIATASQAASPGDGSKALAIAQLRQKLMADLGNIAPDDFYRAMIGNLGTEADAAQRMTQSQQTLVDQIDNQRQSVSGVNLDEEMMDLMRYQHAFQAAARMVNVMDEMISTVVNRLGLGGR